MEQLAGEEDPLGEGGGEEGRQRRGLLGQAHVGQEQRGWGVEGVGQERCAAAHVQVPRAPAVQHELACVDRGTWHKGEVRSYATDDIKHRVEIETGECVCPVCASTENGRVLCVQG